MKEKDIIEKYGFNEFYYEEIESFNNKDNLIVGRVIEVQKEECKVISNEGENRAKLKGSLYSTMDNFIYPAVGDFVLLKPNSSGVDIIYKILKRKSKFSRMDSIKEVEQLVATNFDFVCIVTSLNEDFNINRVERYLATAWESGAVPIIIFTKADLCEDYSDEKNMVEERAIGVPIFVVSSYSGEGILELKDFIGANKTIVFLGSSGVGKSSLVNALAAEEIMKVSKIREYDSKGRHTTTHRQLIMLENETMIIDTPGMKSIAMWAVEDGVSSTFSDIKEFAKKCKFRDCNHDKEPGCRVKEALEKGEISKERWDNYLKLKREARYAKHKEEILALSRNKKNRKKY
jgi:ribosome biogenesis GTPase